MVMNNIIFFGDGNYSKGTSQQRRQSICRCERKLLQELPNELPLLWTACVELAYSSLTQSVQGLVYRGFQDLEKLRKAQKNAWTF